MDTSKIAQSILDAVQQRNWMAVAILVIIAAVWAVRKYAPQIHGPVGAWLNTDRGGSVLVLVLTTLGAIATAALARQPITLNLVIGALMAAIGASGLRNVAYDLAKPADKTKPLFPPAAAEPPKAEPPKAA